MKQLAFIADDFGLSAEANLAILHAYREGALTGASLMLGQPGTEHAIQIARENPGLQIGWHLHLCDSRPTTRPAWPWGASPVRAGIWLGIGPIHRALVRSEIQTSMAPVSSRGAALPLCQLPPPPPPSSPALRTIADTISGADCGWFRGFQLRHFDNKRWTGNLTRIAARALRPNRPGVNSFRQADSVWGIDRLFSMDAGEVRAAAAQLPEGLHEFIFHPRTRRQDQDLDALLALP